MFSELLSPLFSYLKKIANEEASVIYMRGIPSPIGQMSVRGGQSGGVLADGVDDAGFAGEWK